MVSRAEADQLGGRRRRIPAGHRGFDEARRGGGREGGRAGGVRTSSSRRMQRGIRKRRGEERGAIVIGVSRVVAVLELALARPVQVKPKVGRRDRRRCERLPAGTTVGYCVLFSDVISLLFFLFRLSIFNFFFFFLMYEDLQDYKIHNKLAIAQVCYKTKNSKFRTTKQEVLEHLQQ